MGKVMGNFVEEFKIVVSELVPVYNDYQKNVIDEKDFNEALKKCQKRLSEGRFEGYFNIGKEFFEDVVRATALYISHDEDMDYFMSFMEWHTQHCINRQCRINWEAESGVFEPLEFLIEDLKRFEEAGSFEYTSTSACVKQFKESLLESERLWTENILLRELMSSIDPNYDPFISSYYPLTSHLDSGLTNELNGSSGDCVYRPFLKQDNHK